MTGQPDKKPKQQHPTPMQPCPPAYPPPTALLRADGHLRAEPLASPPVPPLRQHGANAADAAYGLMALRFGVASKNQHRGGRLLTELPCEMAGCGRLRESAACRFCAVHCVRQEQEPCRVHWDFPQRCQVHTTFCAHLLHSACTAGRTVLIPSAATTSSRRSSLRTAPGACGLRHAGRNASRPADGPQEDAGLSLDVGTARLMQFACSIDAPFVNPVHSSSGDPGGRATSCVLHGFSRDLH